MSGKRYKFQGSSIYFLTDWRADSPSSAITAVTKANPAVVTETAHGRATGDVIRILGVVGMTELNSGVFIITKIGNDTYSLDNTDSTNYATYTSGGLVDEGTFAGMCELTGYNRSGGSSPEIAATTICSTAQEFEIGLADYGTTQFDYNFAPSTSVQQAIKSFYSSGDVFGVKVILPKSGGTMTQLGFVQSMSEQAAVNGLWTASLTMRNTGPRFDVFV